jgi:ABC-type sulfate/molybdate transport systems ATPase subunit
MLFVTHDPAEAGRVAGAAVRMEAGRVVAVE